MRRIILAAFACVSVSALADIWWVDAKNYGKGGMTGAADAAFGTIQEAIDSTATKDGDTIKVRPGTYDRDSTFDGFAQSRVVVTKKLTIESAGSRADTFIVGRHTSASDVNDGIRCVYAPVKGTVIRGFTLKDGGVMGTTTDASGYGAGVYANAEMSSGVLVVDCTIANCRAGRGGGMAGGVAVRTLFVGNARYGTGNGGIARSTYLLNCVCANNQLDGQPGLQGCHAVNTTCFGNGSVNEATVGSEQARYRNCLFAANQQNLVNDGKVILECRHSVIAAPCMGVGNDGHAFDNSVTNAAVFQMFAPASGDIRPFRGSDAERSGLADIMFANTSTAVLETIPEEERYFDFNGAPIPKTGVICAGAVQAVAPAPTSGAVAFGYGSFKTFGYVNRSVGVYLFPSSYPKMLRFDRDCYGDGLGVFCYWIDSDASANWRPPEMDESFSILPPPNFGEAITNGVVLAEEVYYVDQDKGSSGAAGTSPSTAFATIREATASATTGKHTLVYVSSGTFDEEHEGAMLANDHSNRVVIAADTNVRLKGAGRGLSTIIGKKDTVKPGDANTPVGCGHAACRCVAAFGVAIIQGFTLKDGYSDEYTTQTGGTSGRSGAATFLAGSHSSVADCRIVGCQAYRAFCNKGHYVRCVIEDCYGYNGGMREASSVISCSFTGTMGSGAGPVLYAETTTKAICHCSAQGTVQSTSVWTGQGDSTKIPVWNSVFVRGNAITEDAVRHCGCVVYDYKTMPAGVQYTKEDPGFASLANLRPVIGSVVETCGALPTYDYCRWATSDVDGRLLKFNAAGAAMAGCHQRSVTKVTVEAPAYGTVTPEPGDRLLDDGEQVTVTYAADPDHAQRPFLGFAVDGVSVTDGTSFTFMAPTGDESPVCSVITALASTNWYVNAAMPDDSGDGFTPATAKKTLAGVMGCDVLAGDCVHAAHGDYAEGGMMHTLDASALGITTNRVVVRSGVTLVADEGAAVTFIHGRRGESPNAYGRGPGAMRCAVVEGTGVLRGFTLVDGNTATENESGPSDDRDGGGVYVPRDDSATVQIVDCTITNCAANRGGGGMYGTYVNCRFYQNASSGNGQGDAGRNMRLFGCYLGVQRSSNGVQSPTVLKNCTFDGCSPNAVAVSRKVDNCIFRSTLPIYVDPGELSQIYSSCVFLDNATLTNQLKGVTFDHCRFVAVEDLQLDDGRPVFGRCAAIDAGDNTKLASELDDRDATGGQRIYNGTVDAGAYEYDWRPQYAAALGAGVVVTGASADVSLESGKVRIVDGATIAGTWPSVSATRKARYAVTADAAGEGTLSGELFCDGKVDETFALTDASETRKFKATDADIDFGFGFAGDGYGLLSDFAQTVPGIVLIVR